MFRRNVRITQRCGDSRVLKILLAREQLCLFVAILTTAILPYIHTYIHPDPDCLLSLRYSQTFIAISRLRIQNDHNSPFPLHQVPSHFSFNLLGLDYQRLMSLPLPFCDDFLHETQFGVRGVVSRIPPPIGVTALLS
jgi:hypothetical protein